MLVTNSFTQQDLDALKNGGKVSFDETTPKELVLKTVKMINDYESTFEVRDFHQQVKLPTIEIDAKACSSDTLIALMDYALHREDLLNASLILNIFNLIKQYNSLSESYFNNPRSYIKSIDYLESCIRHQCFRDSNAFGRLVVFEQSRHDARQCKCRPV